MMDMAFLPPPAGLPPRPRPLAGTSASAGQVLARSCGRPRRPRGRGSHAEVTRCSATSLPPAEVVSFRAEDDVEGVVEILHDSDDELVPKETGSAEKNPSLPPQNDPDWMFFDVAKIFVQAGAGGNGCVAFRREKGIPRGGPSGGSGGRGGDVVLVADSGKNTLGRFRGRVHFRAIPGKNGINKGKHGECGAGIEIKIPVGTVVRDDQGRVVADMVDQGAKCVVATGGRGGRGNAAFKTARNNAPKMAESGENGQAGWLRLELKLLADVGLVGVPNAGKSTLLAAISNAKPKIADYPFTTVIPNLGMVDQESSDGPGMVVADIPGLLEGAHSGVGLGTAFLRHIERCRILVHVVNGDSADPVGDYEAINQELRLFNPQLVDKPQVILINKADLPHVKEVAPEIQKQLLEITPHKRVAIISAATKEGVDRVLQKLRRTLSSLPDMEPDFSLAVEASETARLNELEERTIEVVPETEDADGYKVAVWRMICPALERAAQMTNWDYAEAIERYQRVLEAMGGTEALKAAGVQDGDFVRVADYEFEYFGNENIYTAMAISDGYLD